MTSDKSKVKPERSRKSAAEPNRALEVDAEPNREQKPSSDVHARTDRETESDSDDRNREDFDRDTQWDHESSDRALRLDAERPGYYGQHWSSQGEISGLGDFGPPYAPGWGYELDHPRLSATPNKQLEEPTDESWRDGFRGGFGNSGQLGPDRSA